MYEVEVKVPADHEDVVSRLRALEATALGRVHQTDRYYDSPVRSFAATDEALRIRRERTPDGRRSQITYKGPIVGEGARSREEIETAVADADALGAILEHLGFDPVATVEKERERFRLGEETVVLDRVSGLGSFVEVEATTTEDEVERAERLVRERLERLGLDPADRVGRSYLELLLAAGD